MIGERQGKAVREAISLMGMVLKVSPVGEYDRRLVILTRERGKITAFARGAKRPGSSLMAASRPFVFGKFKLYEGRDAYSLASAEVKNYFTEIGEDVEAACYGSYFLEFADYYGRENVEGTELLLLLYQSMRALLKPALPDSLVQLVFELRAMAANGEYTAQPPKRVSDSAVYAWEFILSSSLETLYTFVLKEEVQRELRECVEMNKRRFLDREFKSLGILRELQG